MSIHVEIEAEDGPEWEAFCGLRSRENVDRVIVSSWQAEPETIQRATCEQCLLRIFMLGDSAAIALKRMGMKVEVRDAPAEVEAS